MLFQQLTDTRSADFKACMELYNTAFPESERQAEAVILKRLIAGDCKMYFGKEIHRIVCIAVTWDFAGSEFIFLDYFAVAAIHRGAGIGSKFFSFLNQVLRHDNKFMVMEVEHPAFGDNQEERNSRIRFYKKNGAVLLESTRYMLPPLGIATSPSEMQLMMIPDPSDRFTKEDIRLLIIRIYHEVYERPANDVVLNSFLT